jgi:hypothetical protein
MGVRATHDVASDAVRELVGRLGLDAPFEARPGADLVVAEEQGRDLPEPGRLLRAADGWFHPGPPTTWDDFTAMAVALGAPVGTQPEGERLPDVSGLRIDALDAEAAAWRLPATAVRTGPAAPSVLPDADGSRVAGADVAILGTAWAAPLVGRLLVLLGARVTRVDDPRRDDPFPLASHLAAGTTRVAPDLTRAEGRDALFVLLGRADLLVDGYTPRVLANVGLGDDVLAREYPRLAYLRIAAFADDDRPGYGLAAECRGGWAARTDPPRLGRSSIADPVAGCIAALHAAALLATVGGRARISLEGAVGHLLAREAA